MDLSRGSGTSKKAMTLQFVEALQRASRQSGSSLFTMQALRELADQMGLRVPSFEAFVESLNVNNVLLKKGNKQYQFAMAGMYS